MSTRSVIARTTDAGEHFQGVYHHWDGYPKGLGQQLLELHSGHFDGDLSAMLAELIDAHPSGWSTINDRDFSKPAGWSNDREGGEATQPECYCHGSRKESANPIDEKNASACGCEYVYAFDEGKSILYVLSSFCGPKSSPKYRAEKMVGAFGCGDPSAVWKVIGWCPLPAKVGVDLGEYCKVWETELGPVEPSDMAEAEAMISGGGDLRRLREAWLDRYGALFPRKVHAAVKPATNSSSIKRRAEAMMSKLPDCDTIEAGAEVCRKIVAVPGPEGPEAGKIYRLTAGPGTPCIAAGNTWAESEADPEEADPGGRRGLAN